MEENTQPFSAGFLIYLSLLSIPLNKSSLELQNDNSRSFSSHLKNFQMSDTEMVRIRVREAKEIQTKLHH
jgi:hypothetical protein